MPYNPAIPQPADFLNITSQPGLLANFGQLNVSFGVDHYPFSDLTANNGFHNQVTTPIRVGGKPLPTTNPILFAFQDSANIGTLQYSAGTNIGGPSPDNNVPTPLTSLQSPAAPIILANGATSNILDFTGLPRAYAVATGYNLDPAFTKGGVAYVAWTGTTFLIQNVFAGGTITFQSAVNVLQIKNTSTGPFNQLFWTLQFLRLQ
jgi:hypothetical protein